MDGGEWIHCNKCCALGRQGGVFWFTSCGHIICTTCLNRAGQTPGRKGQCVVCQKQDTGVMEIKQSMRPDILAFFRSPKDLLAEYSLKVKTTIEFQSAHRQRFMAMLQEKCTKAVNYARHTKADIAKHTEHEKHLVAERDEAMGKLRQSKDYIRQLEKLLSERNHEIQRLKRRSPSGSRPRAADPSPHKKRNERSDGHSIHSSGPSLHGNTPMPTVEGFSFYGCPTSTPYDHYMSADHRQHTGGQQQFNTPFSLKRAFEETPLASAPSRFSNTPALLGLSAAKRCHTNSASKKQFF